ncbi:MAG: right-handed parallel beta-helix repeat-containing protein [Mycetocola sp.]
MAALAVVCMLTACTGAEGTDNGAPQATAEADRPHTDGPARGDWTEPGLVDRTGEAITVHRPKSASGTSWDATNFGADPTAGSGDDAPAIRDALAAAEKGDEVLLPPGIYDLRSAHPDDDSANILLRSGVDLRGAGATKTVLVTSFDGEDDSRVLRGVGIRDVIVAELAVTSRHDGPLGDDPKDTDAGGGPMYGIHLGAGDGRPSSRVLVENVSVEKFQRHGISAKATREVTLAGNDISGATGVGPGGQGYGIAIEGKADQRNPDLPDDSRHNVVVGNTFDGEHLRHAILLQFATHNNLVANNTVTGSILDAIDLHGEGEYLNEVRGNSVTGGQEAAIALGNSGGAKNKHDAAGERNWVHHNRLEDNRTGILVILGTPDTLIENNEITGGERSATGIEVRNGPRTKIHGNTITDGTDDDFWAIRLLSDDGADGRGRGVPEGVAITANTILRAANGIRVDAAEDVDLTDNVLKGIGGTKLRIAEDVTGDRRR